MFDYYGGGYKKTDICFLWFILAVSFLEFTIADFFQLFAVFLSIYDLILSLFVCLYVQRLLSYGFNFLIVYYVCYFPQLVFSGYLKKGAKNC